MGDDLGSGNSHASFLINYLRKQYSSQNSTFGWLKKFLTLLYSQNGGGKQPITKTWYFIGGKLGLLPRNLQSQRMDTRKYHVGTKSTGQPSMAIYIYIYVYLTCYYNRCEL
jgi:hypothetical protein